MGNILAYWSGQGFSRLDPKSSGNKCKTRQARFHQTENITEETFNRVTKQARELEKIFESYTYNKVLISRKYI